ncbi:unnamed protein product, partial [Meganyctiphanes norvegica]
QSVASSHALSLSSPSIHTSRRNRQISPAVMENNQSLYKELSYRVKGFRALSVIVVAVTVILCAIVGIGCWVLIAGVQENEKLLNNSQGLVEKIELTVVEGEVKEPLRRHMDASNNKVGRVVQHIAEIDFAEGSPVSTDKDDVVAMVQMQNSALHPAATSAEVSKGDKHEVDPHTYKTSFSQRYELVPNHQMVPPRAAEGDAMATYDIPEEIVVQEIDFNVPQNSANEFSRRVGVPHYGLSKPAVEVNQPHLFQGIPQQQARPEGRKLSFVDSFMSFTNDLAEDFISKMNETIPDVRRALDTFDALELFAPIFSLQEPATHRSERSLGHALQGGAQIVQYASYGAFAKFLYNEINGITEYRLQSRQGRKLPGDAHTMLLDALYWTPTVKPTTTTEEHQVLTAATDDGWEPQVNKVSVEFIGEILNTLLKMMREFLMRDHVMECLWFMFCQDLNHQAKYADAYGMMARVNSVGLKVLTVREERDGEMDTIGEIWKALTAWDNLQCDAMFPKCDGTKALEIVNEVALGD